MQQKTFTTPIGTAKWFSLTTPDKFGSYTCELILEDAPETHKLVSEVESMANVPSPFKVQEDGTVILKMKIRSQGNKKDGSTYKVNPPAIYNAIGKRLSGEDLAELAVGNGSKIRAKIEFKTWAFNGKEGISAKPKSVQIAELIVFQGGGDLGFDALELSETDEVPENNEEAGNYDF